MIITVFLILFGYNITIYNSEMQGIPLFMRTYTTPIVQSYGGSEK